MVSLGKTQLIKMAAAEAGLPQTEAAKVTDALIDAILNTVRDGGEVSIPGLLKISVKERKARSGRNPQTGEVIQIAAKKVPSIKAGKLLKDAAEG